MPKADCREALASYCVRSLRTATALSTGYAPMAAARYLDRDCNIIQVGVHQTACEMALQSHVSPITASQMPQAGEPHTNHVTKDAAAHHVVLAAVLTNLLCRT